MSLSCSLSSSRPLMIFLGVTGSIMAHLAQVQEVTPLQVLDESTGAWNAQSGEGQKEGTDGVGKGNMLRL